MKNFLSVVTASVLVFSSCSDFLDVQPEGYPTTDSYFRNDQQAIDAVDGLYYNFQEEELYGQELFWEQAAANDVVWGRTQSFNTLATFKYTGNEEPLRLIYEYAYEAISRSNWIIQELLNKQKRTELTPVENRSLGEAYFCRAWGHFLIAYRYGTDKSGVPFSRYEDFPNGYDNSILEQRASVVDNYQLIIDDFDHAMEYLPPFESYEKEDRGRAHKAAAVAFKAKVYAYWAAWEPEQWQKVISLVDELETTYHRGLAQSFDIPFSSDFADFWNEEYLWTLPSTGGDMPGGSEFPGVVLQNGGWGKFNGWGQNKPTLDIFEEMEKDGVGNERIRRSILEYNQEFPYWGEKLRFSSAADLESGFQINKYMEPFGHEDAANAGFVSTNGNRPTARINFPVIRFAEMLLFRAEAYLMTGNAAEATKDLNRIRTRSHLAPIEGTATFKDLYHERRCELAFEFTDHLYDLKRWHLAGPAELKELALKELNARPRVRNYEDRTDPTSKWTEGNYVDYTDKRAYNDKLIVFPYPSEEIIKSNGKLKQNEQ